MSSRCLACHFVALRLVELQPPMLVQRNIRPLLRRPGAPLRGPLFYFRSTHNSLQAAEKDVSAARKWLAELCETSFPSNIGEVSYCRSSGPGGQNVNKSASDFPSACSF